MEGILAQSSGCVTTGAATFLPSSSRTAQSTTLVAFPRSLPFPVRPSLNCQARYSRRGFKPCQAYAVATTNEAPRKRAIPEEKEELLEEPETEAELEEPDLADGPPVPTPFEVQSLLLELCDETSIAEVELKVGSFKLYVRRDPNQKAGKFHMDVPAILPPVPSRPMIESIAAAPAPEPAAPRSGGRNDDDDDEGDEGLAYVVSPKVGIFRKGRYFKGKAGKPIISEGADIKVGQAVCYLEQLGTQLAVETEVAGEVVRYLVEDGDPVGFNEPLVAVRPAFPGIKKLT